MSTSSASRHFTTWIIFLNIFLASEFPYPSKEQLQAQTKERLVEAFRLNGMHFEAFIDCHEQQCQTPGEKEANKAVWSEYKQRTTVKFLGAIGGNGAFTFVSLGYCGKITDPAITRLCGYLDVIHEGGVTGADKGFDMHRDFLAKKALLVIPPKAAKGQEVFTHDQMADTAQVARERIHVERAFERAKEFRILHNVIPVTMFDLFGPIFKVCCYLTNYQLPLIKGK